MRSPFHPATLAGRTGSRSSQAPRSHDAPCTVTAAGAALQREPFVPRRRRVEAAPSQNRTARESGRRVDEQRTCRTGSSWWSGGRRRSAPCSAVDETAAPALRPARTRGSRRVQLASGPRSSCAGSNDVATPRTLCSRASRHGHGASRGRAGHPRCAIEQPRTWKTALPCLHHETGRPP